MAVRTEFATRFSAGAARMFLRNPSFTAHDDKRDAKQPKPGARSTCLAELLVSYALILSVNWTSNPARQWIVLAAIAWITGSTARSLLRRDRIEFQMKPFWRSLWIVGVALMLAVPALTIAAKLHTLQQPYGPMGCAGAFAGYAVWAIAQQWLLQGYFLPRLAKVTSRENWAAAIVAGLFALAHLPNLILTAMALYWGLAASLLFLRYRSILTLGFAHAILGIAVAISIPGPVLHNMRVGIAYLRYRAPVEQRLRDDYRVSNATWYPDRRGQMKLSPVEQRLK